MKTLAMPVSVGARTVDGNAGIDNWRGVDCNPPAKRTKMVLASYFVPAQETSFPQAHHTALLNATGTRP
jgi:hypothetical protein